MNITVFYDYICPFSFIGSRRIQKISSEYDIEIEWKGYEIHPEYPPEGKLRKRTARMAKVNESLNSVMSDEQDKFKLPGFVTNTKMALQAAEFAKTAGRFIEFHNACYNAYMIDRNNIGDIDVILDIASDAGIDKDSMQNALKTGDMKEKLELYKLDAEKAEVLGVPTILLNDYRIHGVQSLETYRAFIKKLSN